MLQFHRDERKNRGNRNKHGEWIEKAESVFQDPQARLFCDLLSLAKYRFVRVTGKSGSRAAALQIAASQYHAGLSRTFGGGAVHPARSEFSGEDFDCYSLLRGVRGFDSASFHAEGDQEGGSIL